MFTRLAFLVLSLAATAASAVTPLQAYGHLPTIEQAALSPDGTKIAFVRTVQEARLLAVVSLTDNKLVGGYRLGDLKIRAILWADDQYLLFTTASTAMPADLSGEATEWNTIMAYDVVGNKMWPLLRDQQKNKVTMNVVYGRPIVHRGGEGTTVYLHGLYIDGRLTLPALYQVNLKTFDERLIKQGTIATKGWMLNDQGQVVAEEAYVESDHGWRIQMQGEGRTHQPVTGLAPIDYPRVIGLSPDGDSLVVAVTGEEGRTMKYLSTRDGSWGNDIGPPDTISAVLLSPGSQRMLGTAEGVDTVTYHFNDPELQGGWDWAVRAFNNEHVRLQDLSTDHSRALVSVLGPHFGYAYYLVDFTQHTTRNVGNVYEGVNGIAPVQRIVYAAADGLKINAYLTLPPGREAKNLPLIVLPHGGPQARDTLSFDWWAQALAAQGYAVLQPNYRGSALNQKWIEAGYGEWGRKMQSDLSDGVSHLANQGIADPKRVCIVGGSYGGYAALAGVTLQSGVYRCAISVAGVSDPASMLRLERRKETNSDRVGLRYWFRFMGVGSPDDKLLADISPLQHADRAQVPILLIHGRVDTVVAYEQSETMANALKKSGKQVEFVTLDKEDHHLSRSDTRLQMLSSSVEFLKKYNPPD
jgi:acetyl esterase/lipase